MKLLSAGFFIASLAPMCLQAGARENAESICSIVDRYTQGSYHYFQCQDHIATMDPNLSLEATIDYVCSVVDTFYNLDAEDKERCYVDAKAKLSSEPLGCYPTHNVLSQKFEVPAGFNMELVAGFTTLAKTWDKAYRSKLQFANNGLVSDLQKSGEGCLSQAYSVSLDGPNPLKDALKECVFTDINAYSDPAISTEDQETLADDFVKSHWGQYRFRKIINASLQNDPITAFNTSCVLEIRSKAFDGQRFHLAGYTID